MTDFSYSSWASYQETDGTLSDNPTDFTQFAFWVGEGQSNEDGSLLDVDDDDQWEGQPSGGSDSVNMDTGGATGAIGNIIGIAYYGNITIGGTVYPVFQDPASGDFVLFAQSDDELPNNITIADIDLATDGTTFPFCFVEGTKISTPDGERAVETLAIGDLVRTADGRDVAVRWVGRQKVRTPDIFRHPGLAPVCISCGVLGNTSDLYVSAGHGMVVDGLVITASALVTGDTIRFVPPSDMPQEFTYYHVETEHHEVILANGAPSETFIDYRDRRAFDNFDEYLDLYGCERIIPEMPAPRISSERLVPQDIRQRLGGSNEPMAPAKAWYA